MIKRAEIAVQDGGTIQAILWYQRERDTLTLKETKSYKRKLEKFFEHLRSDLNSPLLPIFQVQICLKMSLNNVNLILKTLLWYELKMI